MKFNNLETVFKKIGLTAEQIGARLGYGKGVLYTRLSGKTSFTLGDMVKIQDFVNKKLQTYYELDYLFAVA